MKKQSEQLRPGERIAQPIPDDLPESPVMRTAVLIRAMADNDTSMTPIESLTVDAAVDSLLLIASGLVALPATLDRIAVALERLADASEGGMRAPAAQPEGASGE